MEVAIVGAGAIGLLTAAYMTKAGAEVTLYTRREEQARTINKEGIKLICGTDEEIVLLNAQRLEGKLHEEIVMLCVKQYHLEAILKEMGSLTARQSVVFLQNGMSHVNVLSQMKPKEAVILGIVEHGALKKDDNTVIHTGIGNIQLSLFSGKDTALNSILSHTRPSFPLLQQNDWYDMLASKLAVNAVINSLTSLYRVKNGRLLEVPQFYQMMRLVFTELESVLQFPDSTRLWEKITGICEKTAGNTSSMLKDFQEGRQTELEAILGYIIERAQSQHIQVPILTFIFESLKGLEGRFDSC